MGSPIGSIGCGHWWSGVANHTSYIRNHTSYIHHILYRFKIFAAPSKTQVKAKKTGDTRSECPPDL